MGTVFIICFACLFLIPGLLIALLNWANISIWVWEKWQNPRSKAETCIAPFLGGLSLSCGIGILVLGLPEYSVPLLKNMVGVAGDFGVELAGALALAGFLIDYGSVPNLIITPLLDFLFGLRNAPKVTTPRGPYCRELQLSFPLLLVGEDELPRLICSPDELPERDADFLLEAPGSTLYSDGFCQRIARVHSPRKTSFWNRLRHRKDVAFWAAEVEYTTPRSYKTEKLLRLMARLVRADDDVWTQFHEAPELLKLLKNCHGFAELLTLGCLAGWWENTTPNNGLPSLNEESITEEDIRRAAAAVVFGK